MIINFNKIKISTAIIFVIINHRFFSISCPRHLYWESLATYYRLRLLIPILKKPNLKLTFDLCVSVVCAVCVCVCDCLCVVYLWLDFLSFNFFLIMLVLSVVCLKSINKLLCVTFSFYVQNDDNNHNIIITDYGLIDFLLMFIERQ